MKKIQLNQVGALICAAFLNISTVFAGPVTNFDDIEYWVGSGDNQASIVVNWWNGTSSSGSFAWGYRWMNTATAFDMFTEIFEAEPALWGWKPVTDTATAVYGIAFDPTYSGLTWTFGHSNPPFPTPDTLGTADPGVLLAEGWNTAGFWSLYDGGTGNAMPTAFGTNPGEWNTSFVGLDSLVLSDNQWIAFGFDPTFAFDGSNAPSSAIAAVPEPAAFALFGAAALFFLIRRRNCVV